MNGLLAALPSDERSRVLSHVEPVTIERGAVLYDAGDHLAWAYFPTVGLVSLVALTRDGHSLELAMVGGDGMVAVEAALEISHARCQAVAQVQVRALRLSTQRLRAELQHSVVLRRVLLHYSHTVWEQTSQAAMCYRFHTVLQRLAKWLLYARDRLRSDVIHMTQASVGALLGSPRTAVTTAAVTLQDLGAIRQRHGRTFIVDPARLRAAACECYGDAQCAQSEGRRLEGL